MVFAKYAGMPVVSASSFTTANAELAEIAETNGFLLCVFCGLCVDRGWPHGMIWNLVQTMIDALKMSMRPTSVGFLIAVLAVGVVVSFRRRNAGRWYFLGAALGF